MQTSIALTTLLMGLAGGPHCVAMCGAACGGIAQSQAGRNTRSMWLFQLGRVLGYSTLGGIAAASIQGLGWLSVHLAALRPVWTLFHVVTALLGLMLLWRARQPVWLESSARRIWHRVRSFSNVGGSRSPKAAGFATLMIGVLWALLPCGLLYSAVLVAALSANAVDGSLAMALFALGSGVSLMAGPWLWMRLREHKSDEVAVRLAGLALFAASGWALWMGLVNNTAPWCLAP